MEHMGAITLAFRSTTKSHLWLFEGPGESPVKLERKQHTAAVTQPSTSMVYPQNMRYHHIILQLVYPI